MLRTVVRPVMGVLGELRMLPNFSVRSWPRVVADILAFRALRFGRLPGQGRRRTVTTTDGLRLTYRLDRGDIQTIREIFYTEVYRPPAQSVPLGGLLDLGANIGLASCYLAKRYGARPVIAVEPDPGNVELLRLNLEQNGIDGEAIQAAVGGRDGHATFARSTASNLGRLSGEGDLEVEVLSIPTLLARFPDHDPVALKMDIEGGEADVFFNAPDLGWMSRPHLVTGESHPGAVDIPALDALYLDAGFELFEGGSRPDEPKTCYIRPAAIAERQGSAANP